MPEKNSGFAIHIEDAADCWRYSGCIVRDISVKESPPALQKLLESLGLRPINNIVDISNLAMMTCGQPLHIFDLECLRGNEIRVRRAKKNEKIRLLDEREINLDENFLLIADAKKPLALAGIMGGLDSGITEKTRQSSSRAPVSTRWLFVAGHVPWVLKPMPVTGSKGAWMSRPPCRP